MVREGGLKLLTRHEVGSFIIMTTAMWLWFSHSGSAGTDCRDERASREEGLQSGRLTGQQNFFPAPFGCLLVCSSAPPPLFWPFLAWGWDSLSLGRGNLICSLLPPVPSRSPSSLPPLRGSLCIAGKRRKEGVTKSSCLPTE